MEHPPLGGDTSPDAEHVQIERWRQMAPAEKLALVSGMTRTVFALAIAGIRDRYPSASEREVFLRFAVLHLGVDLARKAYPETVALDLE
jgi:hypothetical protein